MVGMREEVKRVKAGKVRALKEILEGGGEVRPEGGFLSFFGVFVSSSYFAILIPVF